MRAVVVYESMFGNTEVFARVVADALSATGADVRVLDVRSASAADLAGCDLLVVGAPTHAFSMSRQSTRDDAVRQGAAPARALLGVREWLATLDGAFTARHLRPATVVFDTRVGKVRRLPGSAARKAARVMRAQGFHVASEPISFYVDDVKGPPLEGEVERARRWAADLPALAGDRTAARGERRTS